MEIEHVDEFLKLMAVLTGDNRYVDIVKLDGKEIVNMCDVATRLENLGIQKGLAAYQQHLREYKGKTTTAAPSPGEWEEAFGDADVIFCFTLASVDNLCESRDREGHRPHRHPDRRHRGPGGNARLQGQVPWR